MLKYNYNLKIQSLVLLFFLNFPIFSQNKIYWTDRGDFTINRSNLDGSERELLLGPFIGAVEDIVFDLENGKMYWAEWVRIRRSDLNGENLETLVTGLTMADGIDLDLENDKIYWTDRGSHQIQRSDLDGSNVEILLNSPSPESIALDLENNKIYWTDHKFEEGKIYRASMDGTNKETLIDTDLLGQPFGLALDLENNKMYWTDRLLGTINKANIDGTDIEEIVSNLGQGIDISLDFYEDKIYWIQRNAPKIARSNLNGSEIEELISDDLSFPTGIGLLLETSTATYEEKEANLNILPNPNSGVFKIESDQTIKHVTIFGVNGKVLVSKSINQPNVNIEMNSFPKGIYYLKITFGSQIVQFKKVVIQ